MKLTIIGLESLHPEDTALLHACIARVKRYRHANEATLHLSQRQTSGWLEYKLEVPLLGGKTPFVICCIQRTLDAECEFNT